MHSELKIVFFGNRYFFSDLIFDAFLREPCTIVAGVLPPPRRRATWTVRSKALSRWADFSRYRGWCERMRNFVGLGYFSGIPAEAYAGEKRRRPECCVPGWVGVAAERGIPVIAPEDIGTPGFELLDFLTRASPDLLISAGYTRIIGASILALARHGAYNFHPSKLPANRGGSPVFFTLRSGAPEVTMTCHRMLADVDEGDIAYQASLPVGTRAFVPEVYRQLVKNSLWMPGQLLRDVAANAVPRIKQAGDPSFSLAPRALDFEIDWCWTAARIERLVCAASPNAKTSWRRRTLNIADGHESQIHTEQSPGTVVSVDGQGIAVACGDGSVFRISELRFMPPSPLRRELVLRAGYAAARLGIHAADRLTKTHAGRLS
jgi:methionyl-tRNA formyltransferase